MNLILLFGACVSWIILAISFKKDRSKYRNCYYLFSAIVFTTLAFLSSLGVYSGLGMLTVFGTLLITIFIVPIFLIHNGILMIQKEGRSLSNLLSLGFGILIGLGEIAAFIAVIAVGVGKADPLFFEISRFSVFFSISVIYLSVSFVIFMLYCVFLQIIPRKRDFDYVIIHGAGLYQGDKMTKLLSQRVDKAIQVYQKDPTPPVLIPSGGKGADEKISEAEAIEKYLVEKGIPKEKIIKEDQSVSTMENLKYSKKIIDAQKGRKYSALVTSNYHVYRALRYCKKIGLNCVGIGSPVAFYYWPSALIREYIAVHSERKHLVILIAGWIMCILPFIFIYFVN